MVKHSKLTHAQLGLYADCINDAESTLYNLPFIGKIGENVDIDRLIDATRKAVAAHPILNSVIVTDENGDIALSFDTDKPAEIKVISVGAEEFARIREKIVRPFDLTRDVLSRFEIYKTPNGDYFFTDIHHIIIDGTAHHKLSEDIGTAYNGGEIPPEEYDITDFSEEEYALRNSETFTAAKQYFDGLLNGCEPDCLPAPDVYEKAPEQGRFIKNFEIEHNAFSQFRHSVGISTTAYFTAIMGFLIAKYNYSSESVISSTFSSRNEKNCGTIASLVKMLPFVTQLDGKSSVKDFLKQLNDQLTQSREHSIYELSDAFADYGITNAINFAFQGRLHEYEMARGLDIKTERIYDSGHIERTALIFELCETGKGEFSLEISYRADSYSEEFIKIMANAFVFAAKEFLVKERLDDIELADKSACEVIDKFNQTEYDYGEPKTIVEQFREKAAAFPEHIAVVSGETKLTYKQLDEITDNLAHYLREKGIDREKTVGVLIDRSEYMVICALGVLKACGAYMPLDPTYPPERLNLMMNDSGAEILITTPALSSVIDDNFSGVRIMTEEIPALPKCSAKLPTPDCKDLFIMLYTSGSTGVPKGVMLEHGNLAAFCAWFKRSYKMDENSKTAAYASYGFDACMMDMYPPLTVAGTLYIIPEEMRLDILGIQDYLNKNCITNIFMTTQLGRQFALLDGTKTLKTLTVGGEKLVPLDVPDYALYNAYGPTECTIFITIYHVESKCKEIPIGRPLDNVKLYVVDKNGKMLPPGMAGELWAAGPQVARGYLNRPEKTAEVFTKNPFCDDERYSRVYHTGDVVRYLNDGNIQFIGRRDHQVKIRGFRIELTEVEEVIRRFPSITDATVAAYDNPAGGKYIAAFVCSDEKIDIKALENFIRAEKPPYMVPAVTMQLDAIPYNQNLKVNKRALPKPEFSPAKEESAGDRPLTLLEEKISAIAEKSVGVKITDISSPLTSLGITSLSAISLVTHIDKELGVSLSVKKILGGYSLIDIENEIISELFSRTVSEEKTAACDKYPITQTQFGVYSECVMNPEQTTYNIPTTYVLDKKTGAQRLADAISKVIDAHSPLKCTIAPDENGDIFMSPHPEKAAGVSVLNGSESDAEEYGRSFVQPFDFSKELYRITVFETEKNIFLFTDFHHIIFDGTSLGIFLRDLDSVLAGKELDGERKTIFDIALEEKRALSSREFTDAKSYYDSLLKGCPDCTLPSPDRNEETETAGFECISRPELSAADVKSFCENHGITPNAFFLAAAGLLLGKYAYSDDVCLTTVYNGRNDVNTENSFGMFVKTLPLRCFPDIENKTVDYILETGKQLLANMSNDLFSFAQISRSYGISAEYMIVYQGEGFGVGELDGRPVTELNRSLETAKSDISTDVWIRDGIFVFETEYRANKYSREFIERYTDMLATAAKSMLTAQTLGEVNITSAEQLDLVNSFNDTDYPVELVSVNRLFEKHALEKPELTAVIANSEKLTYSELNSLANRLAHGLIDLGVQLDDIVGVVLDRTKEVYVCEYGILKAGGAFLPLSNEYPDDRIDFCLTDAECHFVITSEAIKADRAELFSDEKPYKAITVEQLCSTENDSNPVLEIPTNSLAYCIYTSGSTGKPKGVMIEHANLCNFVDANEKNDETKNLVYPEKVMLSVAAISFDFSIMESFIPLSNGMTVCMANEDEIHNPMLLCKLMEENSVEIMCGTPSFIMNIVDIPNIKRALRNIKAYDLGAEAFPGALYDKLMAINPAAIIVNGYGPTETTVSCISKIITSSKNITIGRPAANVKAYVMDSAKHVLPVGVSGELVIGGTGVGRGYMKLPEKTAQVFFEFNGERAYRSGDLVRYNSDGEIEFFGRLDNQVKLRGLRVELGEIETVMNEFEGVLVSKVIVRNNGSEDYLAGFFTADRAIDTAELTGFMKSKLTAYMVPAALMQLDEMPLTVNGKIDKNRFPETTLAAAVREYTAPETALEKELCEKFADILGLERVGALDSFFEIGGTSLSATKVVMFALTKGYNIVYKDVFDNPTPRGLAAFIDGGVRMNTESNSDEFDYSALNSVLGENIFEKVDEVKPAELGNIVLTGATGFLGIHVLKEFIDSYDGKVYCLVRKGRHETCEKRLKNMLGYYFNTVFDELFGSRIFCIEGDITDKNSLKAVAQTDANTVINCAACVKHFASDDILERVNVGGVKNLIEMCIESGKRLIQISTTSVAGEGGIEDADRFIHENELFFGQKIDNEYVRTKFLAERAVLEARVKRGLDGKIIRVGNLMSRLSDGEFQINFITNSFMRSLKAYRIMKLFPVNALEAFAEFSPIDSTAAAVLKLAASESKFCVFHAFNDHVIRMADVIYSLRGYGFDIEITDAERFSEALSEAAKDESMADAVLGLVAYESGEEKAVVQLGASNRFTINVLYRLGFKWPMIDNDYLVSAIKALDTLGFFG
ncbi:MAG: amino acid adenylation domain-containing protein [Oscillospiraceae bacterium]|nr:amino acid adenylation domain-containing protein [Oscillospiraceae bacterium]